MGEKYSNGLVVPRFDYWLGLTFGTFLWFKPGNGHNRGKTIIIIT